MNAMERVVADDVTRLIDRLAASMPDGAFERISVKAPRVASRLAELEASLADARASLIEDDERWTQALNDLENVRALEAWRARTEEACRERHSTRRLIGWEKGSCTSGRSFRWMARWWPRASFHSFWKSLPPLDLEVTLLCVVVPATPAVVEAGPVIVERAEDLCIEAEAYLTPIATRLRAGGVRVSTEVRRGEPVAEILAGAKETRAGLIIMTTHGRTGFGRLLFGSVAEGVLRQADVPVFHDAPDGSSGRRAWRASARSALRAQISGMATLLRPASTRHTDASGSRGHRRVLPRSATVAPPLGCDRRRGRPAVARRRARPEPIDAGGSRGDRGCACREHLAVDHASRPRARRFLQLHLARELDRRGHSQRLSEDPGLPDRRGRRHGLDGTARAVRRQRADDGRRGALPEGDGPGTTGRRGARPPRASCVGVWAFALEPVSDHTTRLVMLSLTAKRRLADRIFWEPAHFVMERKMMLTIKQLAEASAN